MSSVAQDTAVVGAAGTMGADIACLLAERMNGSGTLTLIDVRGEGLTVLAKKVRAALRSSAERAIVSLRASYEARRDLVENADIIAEHVEQGMGRIRMSTVLESAAEAEVVFEAVPEDADLKREVLARLARICPAATSFFSATCSIPASKLAQAAGAEGRVMATRFYPPVRERAVVELAAEAGTSEETRRVATELLAGLGKRVVPSPDRAGFIGSAFIAREALYALKRAAALEREWGFPAAIYMMDKISREWLIRPTGIFELIDSMGLRLLDSIIQNMRRSHGAEDLRSAVLDRCLEAGRVGGREPEGAQREGFFSYRDGKITGVFDAPRGGTCLLEGSPWKEKVDKGLGLPAREEMSWSRLSRDPNRATAIHSHFHRLKTATGPGPMLAREYLEECRRLGGLAATDGVEPSAVDAVLQKGFGHLYSAWEAFT